MSLCYQRRRNAFLPVMFMLSMAFVWCQAQESSLRSRAQSGDADAQWQLGMQYREGSAETPKNLSEAFSWFARSAKNGSPKGENAVGLACLHGEGVPENDALGFEWLYKAALKGYPPAQFNLGAAYLRGMGTVQNDSEAFNWFLQAARNGQSTAQLVLCRLYLKGKGIEPDPTMAYAWCLIAHPESVRRIGDLKKYTATALATITPEQAQEAQNLASSWSTNHLGGGTLPAHSRAFLAAQPAITPAAAERSPTRSLHSGASNGCESGHWVDSVMNDGKIVKLEDGSTWKVDDADTVDSSLWLSTDDVIVCDGKLTDTDDHSTVSARRLH